MRRAVVLILYLAPACAQNRFTSEKDAALGARLYQTHCSYCHGGRGEGGRGPDLTTGRYKRGGSDSQLFATIRNGIPGTEMPQVRATDDDVWRMVTHVRGFVPVESAEGVEGDARGGRALFLQHCAACHQNGVGPDLSGIGLRRGASALSESLVSPDAEIPIAFRAITVVTRTASITGIRLNEDDLSIQLRDRTGNLRSFLKSEIREIRVGKSSLMPSFASRLSAKEQQDLIAYLSTLRSMQ